MLLAVTFIILAACAAAEFFKRNFLSRPVVYHITMLFSILAMAYSTIGIMSSGFDFYCFACHIVRLGALAVYIRGHILPIDKSLDRYCSDPGLYAAKRLIFTGILGVCLFMLMAAGVYRYSHYYASQQVDYEHSEDWYALYIAALFYICVFMSFFAGALITNGCIRYISSTNNDGFKRNFSIFLTFVPIVNFFYGIVCFIKIKLEVA